MCNDIVLCPQRQKVRQHRRGSGGLDLHRHLKQLKVSNRQRNEASHVSRALYRERNTYAFAIFEKKRMDVSLHDPIGTDKKGNEITLIDIFGSEAFFLWF